MSSSFQRYMALAKQHGSPLIVHDSQSDDAVVILPLDHYEALLADQYTYDTHFFDKQKDAGVHDLTDSPGYVYENEKIVPVEAHKELSQEEINALQKDIAHQQADRDTTEPLLPWADVLVEEAGEDDLSDDVDWQAYEGGEHWVESDFVEDEGEKITPFSVVDEESETLVPVMTNEGEEQSSRDVLPVADEQYRYEYPEEELHPTAPLLESSSGPRNFFSHGKDAAQFEPKEERVNTAEQPVFFEEPV